MSDKIEIEGPSDGFMNDNGSYGAQQSWEQYMPRSHAMPTRQCHSCLQSSHSEHVGPCAMCQREDVAWCCECWEAEDTSCTQPNIYGMPIVESDDVPSPGAIEFR
jgi:hypothetical protein